MEKSEILSRVCKSKSIIKIPLVEIAGQQRVLIENHLGVVAYSMEEIEIKMCYGKLAVAGRCLKFMQINKEQLVITGHIDSVHLFGG